MRDPFRLDNFIENLCVNKSSLENVSSVAPLESTSSGVDCVGLGSFTVEDEDPLKLDVISLETD